MTSFTPKALMGSFTAAVLTAGVAMAAGGQEVSGAELAVRWDVRQESKVSTAEQAAGVLKDVFELAAKDGAAKKDTYEMWYYALPAPLGTPEGAKTILRKRVKNQGKHELTLKFRADAAFEPGAWQCPLASTPDETKEEVDISVSGQGIVRKYSRSCTIARSAADLDATAKQLGAELTGCKSTMVRLKSKGLKIEEWQVGDRKVLEVSYSTTDSAEQVSWFQEKVVTKLLAAGIVPTDRSKTEIGQGCGST